MKGLKRSIFYCIPALFAYGSGQAQQRFFDHTSIGAQLHYGSFLTMEPKALYLKDSYSYFGEIYFQQATKYPRKPYHSAPQWGAGLFYGHTGSKKYVGNMEGFFSFIQLPLFKFKRLTSELRLGAGLGWIEKPYHKVFNHKNVLIGSPINGYINALWQNEWEIAQNTFFKAGISFSHLSNGSSSLPNLGLNIPALSAGFRYGALSRKNHAFVRFKAPTQPWNVRMYASIGIKQRPWVGSKRYVINVLSAEASRQVTLRSQVGAGVFSFYDRSLVVDPNSYTSVKRDISKIQAGIYLAYDYKVGRLSLPLQIGIPIINSNTNPKRFQQIGIRYTLSEHWNTQLLLKAYGGKADLLHLGLGYKIF